MRPTREPTSRCPTTLTWRRCPVAEVGLVLASGSPRRRDMLLGLGLEFIVDPADIDEGVHPSEAPLAYVRRVASSKATTVAARHLSSVVLAADTTIDLDGAVLAKPADTTDAVRMLEALSGREHLAHTAVAIAAGGLLNVVDVTTTVRMRPLDRAEIDWYVATGEPLDKAGAYAIQGGAAAFVESVSGSVSNVVGLPMAETVVALRAAGIAVCTR
ncbi:MAG: Maf family protein [Ilumatobacteraceae bacterium]|nr:septum formation inhibitor Maf [Ilumatobacteraceae bacterium]